MQYESETFERKFPSNEGRDEHCYRYCTFKGLDLEGQHVTSSFIDCRFNDCDMYWACFNSTTLVGVTFKDCWFKGCSFYGCRFVECRFENCSFVNDNLDCPGVFEGNRWYACEQSGCEGLDIAFARPAH